MQIQSTSFRGYKSPLKTLFKEGTLSSVSRGIYGEIITPNNVSIEHLLPRSKGGENILSNYALASISLNERRGDRPLKNYLSPKQALAYLDQFVGTHGKDFDGDSYIRMIMKTLKELKVIF